MSGDIGFRFRKRDEDIFEGGRNGAQHIHLPPLTADLRLQPAEDILSLVLTDADMQSVTESLNIFDIPVLVRNTTKKIERRAAQFKNATIELRPQVRGGHS